MASSVGTLPDISDSIVKVVSHYLEMVAWRDGHIFETPPSKKAWELTEQWLEVQRERARAKLSQSVSVTP